jgi:hypothetical protein
MNHRQKVIFGLKAITAATIVVGVVGIAGALLSEMRIPLFPGVSVPGWVLGASVAYMGVRYWRRLPELERNISSGSGFAVSNFRVKS